MAKEKLKDWKEITPPFSNEDTQKAYEDWKAKAKIATASREEMETKLAEDLMEAGETPAGKEAVFAYRWGKISVAYGEPTAPKAEKISL